MSIYQFPAAPAAKKTEESADSSLRRAYAGWAHRPPGSLERLALLAMLAAELGELLRLEAASRPGSPIAAHLAQARDAALQEYRRG